jgi:hypothetical protein
VAAAAAGLTVAACSSNAPSPVRTSTSSPSPSSSQSSTPSNDDSSGPVWPLTDLPASSASDAARPAVALAVVGSAPSGLSSADVVFQEISSPVRYLALYHSSEASDVGPIGSLQPTDGQVLGVVHPLYGYDGAAEPYFVKIVDKTKIIDLNSGSDPAPYISGADGLVASTSAFLGDSHADTAPPPLFRYRGTTTGADTLADSGVSRPTSVQLTIPGYGTEEWGFDQHTNRWQLTSGGPQVSVANLVVQSVSYQGVGRHHAILTPEVVGNGKAEFFSASATGGSGGTSVSGTWAKPGIAKDTDFLASNGTPLAFQPGPTWIVLAPPGTTVSTSG